ncbi:MAG: ABC transporter transmembrane domain-containing protein, partial [Cyanobacteria bacterium P01_B01_bin.77]
MFLYLSKIYYLLKGSRAKLIVILFVFLLTSLLEAVGIGLIGPFLEMATEPERISQIPLLSNLNKNLGFINSNNDFVAFLGVIITLIFCFKSVVYFLSKWQINKFSNDQRDRLVNLLTKSYLSLPYEFFLSRNTATLIKNIILETSHFSFLCLLPLLEAIANLTITAALLLLLAKTDPWLLISTLGVLVPISLLFNTLSKKFKNWGVVVSESQREIVRTINHSLGGFKETRVFGCEQYFEKQIEEQARSHARATSLFQTFQMLPRVAIEAVLVIFLVLFVSISLFYSEGGIQELTAVLGVFAVAGMRIIPSSSMFLQSLASLRNGTHTLDVLYHDLREIESYIAQNDQKMSLIQKRSEAKTTGKTENHSLSFSSDIQLSQVTYSYPEVETPALNDLSLVIKKGQSIAFIGKSGAGKTTLVDLILG